MSYEYNPKVGNWLNYAEILVPEVPGEIVLALIAVESAGNPSAHRDNSQFYGLMQMGRMAGIDVGFRDLGNRTTAHLDGDGEAALKAYAAYVSRFKQRVDAEHPETYAILWKGGPGFVKHYNRFRDGGESVERAIISTTEYFQELGVYVPRVQKYVDRFLGHLAVYSERVCS